MYKKTGLIAAGSAALAVICCAAYHFISENRRLKKELQARSEEKADFRYAFSERLNNRLAAFAAKIENEELDKEGIDDLISELVASSLAESTRDIIENDLELRETLRNFGCKAASSLDTVLDTDKIQEQLQNAIGKSFSEIITDRFKGRYWIERAVEDKIKAFISEQTENAAKAFTEEELQDIYSKLRESIINSFSKSIGFSIPYDYRQELDEFNKGIVLQFIENTKQGAILTDEELSEIRKGFKEKILNELIIGDNREIQSLVRKMVANEILSAFQKDKDFWMNVNINVKSLKEETALLADCTAFVKEVKEDANIESYDYLVSKRGRVYLLKEYKDGTVYSSYGRPEKRTDFVSVKKRYYELRKERIEKGDRSLLDPSVFEKNAFWFKSGILYALQEKAADNAELEAEQTNDI